MDKPTFLSLFTGAGGLDLGLESGGFRCLGSVELDDLAHTTIEQNRPNWLKFSGRDVAEVAKTITPECIGLKKQGDLDLLAGAPPCQPFSTAGQWAAKGRKGLKDPRAKTLDDFLEIVTKLKPKIVLLENVPGFASGGGLKYVEDFLGDFDKCGVIYNIQSRVLECSEYGVPQKRRRLILIASIYEDFRWSLGQKIERTAWDALHDIEIKEPRSASGKWAKLLPSIPEGQNYLWHSSVGQGEEIFGNRTRFWSFLLKLAKDKPAWTLAASPGPATGPFHWENRPLDPMEAQRIQTFPKSWKFSGSHRDKIKLIGNATPPLLGERIGRALCKHMELPVMQGGYKLSIPKAKIESIDSLIANVPVEYYQFIGEKAAHPGAGLGPAPRQNQLY